VGLASYLLGIEHESHIRHHPLRGNLFENMVVMEALKCRYHHGKRSNLYFWRDARGNEVDLLIEHGLNVTAVEIRAGATISSDWFRGLQIFTSRLSSPPGCALVYGGTEHQKRSSVTVWPIEGVADMMTEAG